MERREEVCRVKAYLGILIAPKLVRVKREDLTRLAAEVGAVYDYREITSVDHVE